MLLNTFRYLTFELTRECNLASVHEKCPCGHAERYRFGQTSRALTDEIVVRFWVWARVRGFRGLVMLQGYSEPTLALDRVCAVRDKIKRIDPMQAFCLYTNNPRANLTGFDLVKRTDYTGTGKELDNRVVPAIADGNDTPHQPAGYCGRGWGWEILIDHYGNWNLCCGDWRCEESVGNIFTDDWADLLRRYEHKATRLHWHDVESWRGLPRLCRACMTFNFDLHRTGASYGVP